MWQIAEAGEFDRAAPETEKGRWHIDFIFCAWYFHSSLVCRRAKLSRRSVHIKKLANAELLRKLETESGHFAADSGKLSNRHSCPRHPLQHSKHLGHRCFNSPLRRYLRFSWRNCVNVLGLKTKTSRTSLNYFLFSLRSTREESLGWESTIWCS